ncbi:MAG: hypothetical protein ACRDH7_17500 [Actinomycetota bacterium]
MERVDHAPPEDVSHHRWRGDEEIALSHGVWHAGDRLAEHEPETWSRGSEPGCERHRQIELERIGQQEHAEGGRPALGFD